MLHHLFFYSIFLKTNYECEMFKLVLGPFCCVCNDQKKQMDTTLKVLSYAHLPVDLTRVLQLLTVVSERRF